MYEVIRLSVYIKSRNFIYIQFRIRVYIIFLSSLEIEQLGRICNV